MNRINKKLALLAALLVLLAGCRGGRVNTDKRLAYSDEITRSDFLLDTAVTVTLYSGVSQEALDGAFDLCRRYEEMFSRTVAGSEVDRLNRAAGEPIAVSPEVREVLETAVRYSEITGGLYDVTICPVVDLWDFRSDSAALPDERALNEALGRVGWQNIVLEDDAVRLENGAQIDLGSIAKGYIADRMADYLAENGVTGALIYLGGDIRTLGSKPSGLPYRIGIQRPFANHNEIIGAFKVNGEVSVASSGVYERSFEQDGTLYHHILDPATGYPAETGLVSVTVLSERAMDGDALATGLFLLGLEKGMALAESLEGVEAVFITANGTEQFTSGIGDAVEFEEPK